VYMRETTMPAAGIEKHMRSVAAEADLSCTVQDNVLVASESSTIQNIRLYTSQSWRHSRPQDHDTVSDKP